MRLRLKRGRWVWHGVRAGVAGVVLSAALMAAAPAAQAADAIHIVQPGENLAHIAAGYGLSPAELSHYNALSDPDIVWVGQQLLIPVAPAAVEMAAAADPERLPNGDGYYVVSAGDSLSKIAVAYGMRLGDLLRLNGLDNPNHIIMGQHIRVTARVEPIAAADAQPELADAIYIVRAGDSLASIAKQQGAAVEELMLLNGLPNPNFIWTGQRLRVKQTASALKSFGVEGAPIDGTRWIEVDLSDQTLTAWQGDVAVLRTLVSSGKPSTPTVTGDYAILTKVDSQRLTGPGYDIPNVPWIMYYDGDFAIHGAYWHANFGNPTSHGCVNMTVAEAKALYDWTPIGAEVVVHE